ncbi:MAG: LacI family DNA-binding transcriptional regulator [Actinobacteria bacterium]|nr:LacI family DNA-binding transcriptional regulator [Actinomycetota bacterium]
MAHVPAVTISDIATHAGVSVGTVSNVVNRPDRVTEATRIRVREAIKTLGWVPNGSAATLRAGQATLVGLIVPDIRNPFFTEVARGAEDMAAANGEAIVICNTDWLLSDERRALEALARQRVRGIIINPAGEDERYLEWLSDRGIALVLLDHRRSAGHVSSVVVDDVLGGRLAGEHLLQLGHRRIALVNGPISIPQCEDRRLGLVAAMSAAGLDQERDLIEIEVEAMDAPSGLAAVEELFGELAPTAVFCANDLLAIGVIRGLRVRRLRAPDDVELAAMTDPPLTTVHQPSYELGATAYELLRGGEPEQRLFSPHLVRREST